MKRALALLLLAGSCSSPAQPAPESAQAWERLRGALFMRAGPDGRSYGEGELDPLLFPASTYLLEEPRQSEIRAALDAAPPVAGLTTLERALWQRDLWCVFDWLVEHQQQELAGHVAPLLKALALDVAELRALPAPREALPSAEQGWVQLADERGWPIAPMHLQHRAGRSHFEVLLRLPQGRAGTLAYIAALHAAPRQPAQFPAGTAVALVRRLVLFDTRGDLVLTPLVESVQLRTYRALAAPQSNSFDISAEQDVAELHLTRDGRLRALRADEPDFSSFGTHGEDPFDEERHRDPWLPKRALQNCGACHGQAGIYGVNSFTRMHGGPGTITDMTPAHAPTIAVEADASRALEATLAYRRDSDSWRTLFPR